MAAVDQWVQLARRLRSLRTRRWPDRRITQGQLAEALGVSTPLISSWESQSKQAVPPVHRLEAYATFFASERSVTQTPYRLLALSELAADERARREDLIAELLELSDLTTGDDPSVARSPFDGTLWCFPQGEPIIIACSELPIQRRRGQGLYANPQMPDYVELYKFADLDALIELYGHIRAANPRTHVQIRVAAEMHPSEYASHLVLLGGVDWNQVTASVLPEIDLPVRQMIRSDDSSPGGFEVGDGEQRKVFAPALRKAGDQDVLEEDVVHLYRSTNPFNSERTVTICNGTYQRGTLGVVRALTDERFRDRNDQYLRARFAGTDTFSLISRVRVVNGVVLTPDWTKAENRLHEWPAPT